MVCVVRVRPSSFPPPVRCALATTSWYVWYMFVLLPEGSVSSCTTTCSARSEGTRLRRPPPQLLRGTPRDGGGIVTRRGPTKCCGNRNGNVSMMDDLSFKAGPSRKRRRTMATASAVGKRKRDWSELVHSEALHSGERSGPRTFTISAVPSQAALVPVDRLLGGFLCAECGRRGPQHDACGPWHMPSCSWAAR